ncbi:MAG: DUF2961 domain-containing protein [Umezawaea sp.]
MAKSFAFRARALVAVVVCAVATAAPGAQAAPEADTADQQAYGLPALERLDRLPELDSRSRAGGDSTFARDGGYADNGGYLYEDETDRVYTDLEGPGEITRIWATAVDPADVVHVYFDGERTPRISMPALTFFSGDAAPFRAPLVLDDSRSSGGWVSYLPLPFAHSVRVGLARRPGLATYFQVDHRLFEPGTPVRTWTADETGAQDSSQVRAQWAAAGVDPKPAGGDVIASGTTTAPSSGATTLLDVDGPRSISSIRLRLPAITSTTTRVTDGGRAFGAGGRSRFTVAVAPDNTGVALTRRLDFGVGDQKADVYVDGAFAGTWYDEGASNGAASDGHTRWRDSTFRVPPALTAGRSHVTAEVRFVSSAVDWNEFRYWVRSTVQGSEVLTDTVDVLDSASESAHAYSITGATWAGGTRDFYYPADRSVTDLLGRLSIRIRWDGATKPAVDAPLGSLFAIGSHGFSLAPRTLMAGVDPSGALYLYFPMPFARHATVELVNSGPAVGGIGYEIAHRAQSGSFDDLGYFSTEYREQSVPASYNHDVDLIDRDGQGTVVGLVTSARGAPGPVSVDRAYPEGYPPLTGYQVGYFGYIEGDEKFYVDGNRTPVAHGTGIEDFGNGGFGWNKGFVATATHGFTTYRADKVGPTDWVSRMSTHRIMLADRVGFTNHVRLSLEHGLVNDFGVDRLDTLVYYYVKPERRSVPTDALDVGVAASEAAHSYTTSGTVVDATRTQPFEGDFRDVHLTDEGRFVGGSSRFTLAVAPANDGVVLRNRFDQSKLVQEADVSVDGAFVGTWRAIGGNTGSWKATDFRVPASFTRGRSSLRVTLTTTAGSEPLGQFTIQAYTTLTGAGADPPPPPGGAVGITNPGFETGDLTGWRVTSGSAFTDAGVTTATTQDGVRFGQRDTHHFWGYAAGGDGPTGSMRTDDFTLGGDGVIRFLVAGGNDIAHLDLALVRSSDGRVLLSATGKNHEAYSTRVLDAGEWVGATVHLRATDTASGGWGHLNLDAFEVPVAPSGSP